MPHGETTSSAPNLCKDLCSVTVEWSQDAPPFISKPFANYPGAFLQKPGQSEKHFISTPRKSYFYVESESPIASALVMAPIATQPFIWFCGDYREINKYIKIPQQPIPIIHHELTKAAGFKIFIFIRFLCPRSSPTSYL